MTNSYTFSLAQIHDAARWFWERVGEGTVVALHGHMGAGKTSFVHALCDVKGVTDAVSSPTFSLVNEYLVPGGGPIYHLDLYRLRDAEEAMDAGMEDILYSGATCLVEWPEKAEELFPPGTVHVYLTVDQDGNRTVSLAGEGNSVKVY